MKEKLYIAYGSNLDRGQMARRCPTAEVVCSGMLYGHELLFRGSQFGAVATVEPKPGACVPVLVWKIKPSDERALSMRDIRTCTVRKIFPSRWTAGNGTLWHT